MVIVHCVTSRPVDYSISVVPQATSLLSGLVVNYSTNMDA